MAIPKYYSDKNIYYWSQTKVRMPMSALICEYMIRQPEYKKAKKEYENAHTDDPQDLLRDTMLLWDKPTNIRMTAGSAIHHGAMQAANGKSIEDAFGEIWEEGYTDTVRKEKNLGLKDYEPVSFREDDKKLKEYLTPEIYRSVLENATNGYQEALRGANIIVPEEKIEVKFDNIEVPVVGYVDAFGNKCVVELKTKWDTLNSRAKSGFSSNSTPSKLGPNEQNDVTQVSLYKKALGAEHAKIIYANRLDYKIHDVTNDMTENALKSFHQSLRVRQNQMKAVGEGEQSVQKLISTTEADFSYFMFRDYHPDQIEIFKQIFLEQQ